LNGRVAAVLGAGPGLAAAVARRFAREGFAVALMARKEESVAGVREEIEGNGGAALYASADATDPASVEVAFGQVRDKIGDPEVFVYNAGAFQMGGVLEVDSRRFDECFKANCAGAFYAAQQVLPAMIESGRGTILFTGATASLRGSARFSALAVGKFGLRALAQSMAREFGLQGIHVAHVIIDGQINTPSMREMSPDREHHTMLSPDAIAET
jgi:NAD(P)-dependent dehydrogenase (short-subunit alcohol dehydrogenase family)